MKDNNINMNNNTPLLYRGIYVVQMGLFFRGPFLGFFLRFSLHFGAVYGFLLIPASKKIPQVQALVLDRKDPSTHFFDILSWSYI
jgi:hypothetical protein